MHRRIAVLVFVLALAVRLSGAADKTAALPHLALTPPTTARALAPNLATGPDGQIRIVWVEPEAGAAGKFTLRFSTFDAAVRRWSEPHVIAAHRAFSKIPCESPFLVINSPTHFTAAWLEDRVTATHPYISGSTDAWISNAVPVVTSRILISVSTDGGASWSQPRPLTASVDPQFSFSLCALADGRTLALWIEAHAPATQVCARIVEDLATGPDVIVAAPRYGNPYYFSALVTFPDESALAEFQDPHASHFARYETGAWQTPYSPIHDDLGIPALAAKNARVSLVWSATAGDNSGLFASTSPDAGERFLMPVQISRHHATCIIRPAAAVLGDGTTCFVWCDLDDSLHHFQFFLATLEANGSSYPPVPIAPEAIARISLSSLALVKDRDTTPALLMLAYSAKRGGEAHLVTQLLTVPAPPARDDSCDCDKISPEDLRGFALHGRIDAVLKDRDVARVSCDRIPGIMPAGVREFKAAPEIISALQPGREILGRIESRDHAWWLFDVRLLRRRPAP